jgi:hypothetical protein
MKLKLVFVAAVLALMVAPAAQAQLDIVLNSNVQSASPPETLTFTGTVTNLADFAITLDGDGISVPVGINYNLPNTDLLTGTWPVRLEPGQFFAGPLFTLDVPDGWTDLFGGTYAAFGTDDAGNQYMDSADFRVTIQGPTPTVPEPGTMLLLGSGLAAAWRKRRQLTGRS